MSCNNQTTNTDCSGGCANTTSGNDNGCTSGCWETCAGDSSTNLQCPTLGDSGGGCTCSGNCSGECKDKCKAGCNSSCSDDEAVALYTKLLAGLNKKIYAADMQNINDMIISEARARRRDKASEVTSVNFTARNKLQSSQVKQLQTNLEKFDKDPKENADVKVKAWRATGEELRTITLAAAKEDVFSSKTGD